MSLESLRKETNEKLLRFLWRQWSQLGVRGNVEFEDQWIIDPEALLLFTMDVGRMAPRLFDEVIAWAMGNDRWVSMQRLKNIAKSAKGETKRALAAFATLVDADDTKHRWRTISRIHNIIDGQGEPFFIDPNGEPLPLIGEFDQSFQKYGFARSKPRIGSFLPKARMGSSANLMFKLRSLFGLGPRAEVMAYLISHPYGKASVISRSVVYSQPSVLDTLIDLAKAGFISFHAHGICSADNVRWQRFLELPTLPVWVEWPRIFTGLLDIARCLRTVLPKASSEYLLKSEILSLSERLRDSLAFTGLGNPFEKQLGLDEAAEAFKDRVRALVDQLSMPS